MESSKTGTVMRFKPKWQEFAQFDEDVYGPGWRVCDNFGEMWAFLDRDCVFARKKDCQAACDALNELKASHDSLMAMNDDEFGAVIVKYLNW